MRFLPVLIPVLLAAQSAFAADRAVTDDVGRTVRVPEAPQRIVVLHEPLLGVPIAELGLAPIGSLGRADDGKSLMSVDFYRVVLGDSAPKSSPAGIGSVGTIDLEKVRALNPDLIIGTEYNIDKAEQLSAIAPVYLQNSSTGVAHGIGAEAALSRLLNRQEAFAKRKATYLDRVRDVKSSLPRDAEGKTYLAIFITDQINAVGEMSGMAQALEDLGYQRMSLNAKDAIKGMGSTLLLPISSEMLGRLNPDLLLVMNTYAGGPRDEAGIRAALERIVPGWERFLKPAREGRIVFLDSAKVTTPSIASAEHTLDAVQDWASKHGKGK